MSRAAAKKTSFGWGGGPGQISGLFFFFFFFFFRSARRGIYGVAGRRRAGELFSPLPSHKGIS